MKVRSKWVALGLLSLSTYCEASTLNIDYLRGLYVGAGVSDNIFRFENSYSFNPNKVDDVVFYNRSNSFIARNVNPNLVIGYGKRLNALYLGLEAGANFNNLERSNNNDVNSVNQYTLRTTYSLSGKVGYYLLPMTRAYGLVGAVRTNLKHNIEFNPNGPFSPLDVAAVSQSKNVNGKILGIGIEQAYSQHLSFAAEYDHIFYNDTNFPLQHDIFKFLGDIGNNKVKLSQDIIMLKAIYSI